MNAVVATPAAEQTVTLKPTPERPRELIITRSTDRLHVTMLTAESRALAGAGSSLDRAYIVHRPNFDWLNVGNSHFAVSRAEAETLHRELQIEVRP